ncbi:MAG: tRNA (adenosine(37)-N6)-threonylcarbamoyltransferase complex ATPase subunit type 1 TsaE [Clostridiales bacterium]|nr:tRNA (adenosine(37)-N6)-threonylcarbamoyltransferase complex ATPase subunit type 1 TsaE [Clostridiales bacterium]
MKYIYTGSEADTEKLGKKIGNLAWPGIIILIKGDLGAGKTVLARGIAKGLGIDEPITSPTFTLIHQYNGRLPLYHFDMYRLYDAEELYDLGFEEYFFGSGVTVVEWPERLEGYKLYGHLQITIEKDFDLGTDDRRISIDARGELYEELKKELMIL